MNFSMRIDKDPVIVLVIGLRIIVCLVPSREKGLVGHLSSTPRLVFGIHAVVIVQQPAPSFLSLR